MLIFNSNQSPQINPSAYTDTTLNRFLENLVDSTCMYRDVVTETYQNIFPAIKYKDSDIMKESTCVVCELNVQFFTIFAENLKQTFTVSQNKIKSLYGEISTMLKNTVLTQYNKRGEMMSYNYTITQNLPNIDYFFKTIDNYNNILTRSDALKDYKDILMDINPNELYENDLKFMQKSFKLKEDNIPDDFNNYMYRLFRDGLDRDENATIIVDKAYVTKLISKFKDTATLITTTKKISDQYYNGMINIARIIKNDHECDNMEINEGLIRYVTYHTQQMRSYAKYMGIAISIMYDAIIEMLLTKKAVLNEILNPNTIDSEVSH